LATLDSAKVADMYSKKGVLQTTGSVTPRNTKALIIDFYNHFLKRKPQAEIL